LESLKGRDYLEDLSTDGKVILNLILRNRVKECGLEYVAQDRDYWWAVVNMVMNFQIP
jgi:hypothetical protein